MTPTASGMAEADPTPLPTGALKLAPRIWKAGTEIHRIHESKYRADEFNGSGDGNARFSPIATSNGAVIPTLYGGGDFECAAMEVPFHDVPFEPGLKTVNKSKRLAPLRYSIVVPRHDLTLADLTNVALRKLGVARRQLIDTDKDQYPRTRQWAVAIHAQDESLQGLYWTSRQDDTQPAIMLFGDRLASGELESAEEPRSLIDDRAVYRLILGLAERLGVNIAP